MSVQCPYCNKDAMLVKGAAIYPHRPDLFGKNFWRCKPCDAYVGCHSPAHKNGKGGVGNGTVPLGRLANAELRRAKQAAHTAFDPLWKPGGSMNRGKAYAWLAGALDISPDDCHIGMFDVDTCRAVVAAVANWKVEAS
jgi:hypothetical protein